MLAQENNHGHGYVMYYLSHALIKVEEKHTSTEKLCLCILLVLKLCQYMFSIDIYENNLENKMR
jgi:hypothetical protein